MQSRVIAEVAPATNISIATPVEQAVNAKIINSMLLSMFQKKKNRH
ncbi:MAG: hypothetical protein J1E81_01590 [Eubacterium sp.]|nr:hypothetical protein [Eubacterium sp.]